MTVETVLAILVSWVFNPLSMWYAIMRKPFGWVLVIVGQVLFFSFVLTSWDWRFGGQGLCLIMGIYGTWKWYIRRDHEPALGDARERYTVVTPMGNVRALSGETLAQALTILMTRCPGEAAAALRAVRVGAPVSVESRSHPQPVHTPVGGQRPATSPEVRVHHYLTFEPRHWADRTVAEDAIAALNHYDRGQAQELRERLEVNR